MKVRLRVAQQGIVDSINLHHISEGLPRQTHVPKELDCNSLVERNDIFGVVPQNKN
jgi:hypothetical protein